MNALPLSAMPWLAEPMAQLAHLANHQQLAHALLITGVPGIGKAVLSEALAHFLLCKQPVATAACGQCKSCLLLAAGNHADLLQLSPEGSSIGVDEIRRLIDFTQGASQQQGNKVIVLPAVERLTEAAANALLKTLEEPPAGCYLVLQSSQPQRLKATLLSRCQRWQIPALNQQALTQWLASQTPGPLPPFMFAFSGGAPLKALAMLANDHVATIEQILAALNRLLEDDTALTELVKTLEGRSDTAQIISYFISQCLQQHRSLAAERQQRVQMAFYRWCRDEQQILGQNKTLAITALLLELKGLMAPR